MDWKKIRVLLICIMLCLLGAACLSACGGDGEMEEPEGVKVTFDLGGGEYLNSKTPVRYYFPLREGATIKLSSPTTDTHAENYLARPDYYFDGWYRSRVEEEDGTVTYDGLWDLEKDRVEWNMQPFTLYARWMRIANYGYSIKYIDDEGAEQTIVTYSDFMPGAPFVDLKKKAEEASAYPGHTVERRLEDGKLVVNYYEDATCTTLRDPEEGHPGGEGDVTIDVYVKFLKGSYTYVYTPDSLNDAISGFSDNIILLADIDMAHQTSFKGIRAGTNFKKNIIGNNFSIKNATLLFGANNTGNDDLFSDSDLDSGRLLFVSLFGNLSNVTIEDLTVENLKVELDTTNSQISHIYFAPVCVKAEGVTLKNVKVKGSFEIKKLPSDFAGHEAEKLHIVKDNKAFYYQSEDTTVEGCEFNVTVTDSRAAANG